ncbi:hypothetical protein [Ideonella sp. BN130291]|uniref:hypothetical protein n=1 Tax=Ideonella sp. BN130291 TaxID=3112940 RepID=UPI002E25EA18|nr:hypothetical protein [Ideonella sp. BN130291]
MNARLAGIAAICVLWATLGLSPARAQVTWADVLAFKPPADTPVYTAQRLAKAPADECFNGIGVDYPPINPDGSCNVGTPKKNQAYVWGLAQAGLGDPLFVGDEIWFGTVANPLCGGSATGLFEPQPELKTSWVCEYGMSMLARRPVHPLPPSAGDWRLPRAYSYNVVQRRLTERTPADPAFQNIFGLRSAGALGRAVFLAGPTFSNDVTFAAWDAASGSYRGACRATALNQIRQWITVNGVLYAGAGRDAGDGVILRWRGTVDNPFNGAPAVSDYCGFEVVGVLPSFPSYLANYDGKRIAASVWNKSTLDGDGLAKAASVTFAAGIYLGPLFGTDGQYTSADAAATWTRIWSPLQYETDPVVAGTTGGGAIAFWKGWLWFGTMHNNSSTSQLHASCTAPACFGPPASVDENVYLLFNVSRAASLWRARVSPTGGLEVQLLYGQTELPALVPGTKTFQMKPTGWTPRHGKAGFDNPFVTYTWAASAGSDDLLFGMYDYRYVFDVRMGLVSATGARAAAISPSGAAISTTVDPQRGYGADLWRFNDPEAPARAESLRGFGNFTNYGVRNMLRLNDGPNVIVGTASGLNLEPDAGWELQLLTAPVKARAPATPAAASRAP